MRRTGVGDVVAGVIVALLGLIIIGLLTGALINVWDWALN